MPIAETTCWTKPARPDRTFSQHWPSTGNAPRNQPLTPAFLQGAHIAYAHAALQREGGRGYLGAWARQNLPQAADRNAFFEQVGRALTPAREAALAALPPDAVPAQVLKTAGG